MKPTRECDQQERMLRALLVLEGLTYFMDKIMCSDPKTPIEHFVHNVYAIAHAAHGNCCSPSNWVDLIDRNAKLLKDANLMDIEKIIQEIKNGTRPKRKGICHILEEAGK